MAIPLALVSRLEEFPRSAVERVGPQQVVQYREEILPLVPVSRLLRRARNGNNDDSNTWREKRRSAARPLPRSSESASIQVVVLACKGQRLGLVVDQILDIAQEAIVSRSPAHRPGLLFTAVIQGRVTEFLDVEGILGSVAPEFLGEAEERELGARPQSGGNGPSSLAAIPSGKA
jgi:two-component system chemotaxis sensor kinase CheA